jgi:SAM-dependent methyltransferase
MTIVVSPIEKEFLLQEDPQLRIEVLSNIHEVTPCTTPFCDRKDLMFVGGFNHLPNVDAMKWFTKEIFPHITKSIPDIKLYIIGSDPTKEIERLASSNIIVVGYAKDLTPYFNNCRVFVSPLRYGAGVKGKINQSMSFGLPVISTSIGAEGMGLIEGKDILLADTAEVFAQICVDIYYNEKLWNELSKNSITNVQEKFSATVWKPKISSLLDSFFIDEIAYKMKKEWNARGKANYKYFISYSNSEEEFIHSGKESLEKLILPIMDSITHNRDPNELKVLEIGCGAGRVTFWMASVFGEVYGVDIAEDMIEKGKKYCKNLKNVHLSTNNGMDLSDFGNDFFDFVFSFIVFQHIPDKNIIINYIKEVERVLKHGRIFKFQLQGYLGKDYADKEKDSWYGVSFSEEEIKEIAEKFNFEIISLEGQGTQYFWIIFKKR